MAASQEKKPRFVPHSRSPLHFITECIRFREWELSAFPGWADVDIVQAVLVERLGPVVEKPFATGLRERHADRHLRLIFETRARVTAELAQLAPDTVIPEALTTYCAAQRVVLERVDRLVRPEVTTARRSPEALAAIDSRRRLCKAFAGIFVTYGRGDLTQTATIARQHTPTKDHKQTAQYCHARDALGAIAREIGPLKDDAAYTRLAGITLDVRQLLLRSVHAWGRLRQMPGYRRTVNHEQMIEEALESGQLGAWLDDPLEVPDTDRIYGAVAAANRLQDYVTRYFGSGEPARGRKGRAVSLQGKVPPNAIISPAS